MTTTIHSPPRCHCESREVCEQFPSNRFPRPRRCCYCLRWVHHSPPFRSKSMWCDRQSREEPPHAHDCSFFLPRFGGVCVCVFLSSLSLSFVAFFDYCQKSKFSLSLRLVLLPASVNSLSVCVCVCVPLSATPIRLHKSLSLLLFLSLSLASSAPPHFRCAVWSKASLATESHRQLRLLTSVGVC